MDLEKSVIESMKEIFEHDYSGHDFWHSMRVYKNAMRIAEEETCNQSVVMLGSLLHDVDDKKLFQTENYANARKIMKLCNVNESTSETVIEAIRTVSFQGNDSVIPRTIEGKIRDRRGSRSRHPALRADAPSGSTERPLVLGLPDGDDRRSLRLPRRQARGARRRVRLARAAA